MSSYRDPNDGQFCTLAAAIESTFHTSNPTRLETDVAEWLLDQGQDYDDGAEGALKDLMYGGCQSGVVGKLIYYSNTEERLRRCYLRRSTPWDATGLAGFSATSGTPVTCSRGTAPTRTFWPGSLSRKRRGTSAAARVTTARPAAPPWWGFYQTFHHHQRMERTC